MPLPRLLEVRRDDTAEPTRSLARHYRRWYDFVVKTFPQEDNPDAFYPARNPRDFVEQQYVGAPQFHRDLAQELFTLLQTIEADRNIVNGHELYDHQFADIATAFGEHLRTDRVNLRNDRILE